MLRSMRHLSVVAAITALLLAPASALAAQSPSPTLGTVLAEPVARGFTEVQPGQGAVSGPISLAEIASAGVDPNQAQQLLTKDGFVGGWGRTWIDNAGKHELQELVIAFSGGAGATKWLTSSKKTDTENQYFIHPISVQGVGSYYGAHLANPMQSAYLDLIGLVKGNDYFLIAQGSLADDLDTPTATQAKGQYDFAPSSTIPPSQWPEHPVSPVTRVGTLAGQYWPYESGFAAVVALTVLAFVLVRRRRGPSISEVQMSPDGTYWWDGRGWRDSSQEAPPSAMRSGDGYYWWDGRMWRLMPESPALPEPAAATEPLRLPEPPAPAVEG